MYALSSAQMRALEDRCAEAGIRRFTLMENAGRAAALAINGTIPVKGKKCVVFCGSGNNGGDGFIVAAELKKLGAEVQAGVAAAFLNNCPGGLREGLCGRGAHGGSGNQPLWL